MAQRRPFDEELESNRERLNQISDEVHPTPSPFSFVFQQPGNAANRVDARATAFSHRGALCEWGWLSSWLDPVADDVNVRWTRELAERCVSSPRAAITSIRSA